MTEHLELLGGATWIRTRARGFTPWNPQAKTLQLLDQVGAVLGEYEDYLPLTIRQIFYRLVGVHSFEKTEQAYERLCETLNRARRARLIPMAAIRDDGGTVLAPENVWRDADHFLNAVRGWAARVRLDRTIGQDTRLVVMCEAAGMAPQLARVADPFGVATMSGGGFDSLTDKYKFAAALARHDRPTEVLHMGDHDPSGVNMFLAFLEDVEAFTRDLGGRATFTRFGSDTGADSAIRPANGATKEHGQSGLQRPDLPSRSARARRTGANSQRRHRKPHRSRHLRTRQAAREADAARAAEAVSRAMKRRKEFSLERESRRPPSGNTGAKEARYYDSELKRTYCY
jgi:hypothetical protein